MAQPPDPGFRQAEANVAYSNMATSMPMSSWGGYGKRSDSLETLLTVGSVVMWMSSNLGVLLLNKLLLSYWGFRQPVLLTFLHMASSVLFIWGLWGVKSLKIQRLQSRAQLVKVVILSLVFALAVLCANVSLKFLEVSMNQAIGAATPVFAAIFAFIIQGERESLSTYSTLLLVVGGVIIASGVEPNLNIFGACICFMGAALRGLRAVMQALLLKPEEKLDSMSCLAYMAPVSAVLMIIMCPILEPASIPLLMQLPFLNTSLVSVVLLNCCAAFASNYFNMVVTKRTSALTIQVLGQCKGVISAVVSVLCFHNLVPVLGWCGYSITVVGCFMYGRCKTQARKVLKVSMSEMLIDHSGAASGAASPSLTTEKSLTEATNRRSHNTGQFFRPGASDSDAQELSAGGDRPNGLQRRVEPEKEQTTVSLSPNERLIPSLAGRFGNNQISRDGFADGTGRWEPEIRPLHGSHHPVAASTQALVT